MSAYNIVTEADDDRDDLLAKEIACILAEAYPGHQWHVRIGGGMLVIKHMRLSDKMGIARKYDRLTWDAGRRKKEVVMAAGEFLERAGLTRGRVVEGEVAKMVEGATEKQLLPVSMRTMH